MNRDAPLRSLPCRQDGFTLPELLVVLALLGLALAVTVPLTAEAVRAAKVRTAADQFASDLRAARMVAVTKRQPVQVTVAADPTNRYTFPDVSGTVRTVILPSGVRIVSSTSPITFQQNGSVTAPATTVFEASLDGTTVERWTVTTTLVGVPKTQRQRL